MNKEQQIKERLRLLINKEILGNQTVLIEELINNFDYQYSESPLITYDYIDNAYYWLNDRTGSTLTETEYDRFCDSVYPSVLNPDNYTLTDHDIKQWFLVTEWLADKLFALGQPVIRRRIAGYWWGRTQDGISLEGEYVLQQIAKDCLK